MSAPVLIAGPSSDSAAAALEASGFEIRTEAHWSRVLVTATRLKPDIVLIYRPDAIETVRSLCSELLNETGLDRSAVVVVLDHRPAADEITAWLDAGVDCCFGEPDDAANLPAHLEMMHRLQLKERRIHELMRYIIQHDPNAIAVYDRDLRYVYVSDRYLEDYNVQDDSIIGKHHYEVFPEMPERWKKVHARVLKGAVEQTDNDWFERPDGTLTYNRWECRPWYLADGSIGGMITYTEVTTERVAAEEERARLERQLRQSQKMEAVGRLAGGIAHDFNNMLTVIDNSCDLITMALRDDDPIQNDIAEIKAAAGRSAELTRQLLGYSRQQIIDPRPIDLNDAVSRSLEMLRRLVSEDIELEFFSGDPVDSVLLDVGQLDQVLFNLAANARDAMPDGGSIVIETQTVTIDESYLVDHPYARPGRHVVLAFSDTGTGMSEETRAKIFEPFFTTKEVGKGSGLGMSTVYGIVKQNNGHVEVYSEPNHGTTVKIYLPSIGDSAATAGEPATSAPPGGRETILLVEDEDAVRAVTERILCSLGYRVLAADGPASAIALVEETTDDIALVLTDVVMPGMSGRECYERLSRDRPGLRVLYTSGYTERTISHQGVLQDGTHFIAKPFAVADLARKLREILDA